MDCLDIRVQPGEALGKIENIGTGTLARARGMSWDVQTLWPSDLGLEWDVQAAQGPSLPNRVLGQTKVVTGRPRLHRRNIQTAR